MSRGVTHNSAQDLCTVAQAPWLLIPALFLVATALLFNSTGGGARDAADPTRSAPVMPPAHVSGRHTPSGVSIIV